MLQKNPDGKRTCTHSCIYRSVINAHGHLLPTGICTNGCSNCLTTDSGPYAGNGRRQRGVEGGGGGGGGAEVIFTINVHPIWSYIYGEN